jgi:hypothetical protein
MVPTTFWVGAAVGVAVGATVGVADWPAATVTTGVALGAFVAAVLEHALATRAAIAKTLAIRIRE